MHRKLVIGAVAAVVITVAFTSGSGVAMAAEGPDIVSLTSCENQVLSSGSAGPCVLSLQHSLAALGVGLSEDGQYGNQTQAAVSAFQGSHPPLAVDGIAGAETITAVDRAANSPQPLAADTGTVAQAQPGDDAVVGEDSVFTCGNFLGTCSLYFSRGATRDINNALNDPGVSAGGDIGQLAICQRIATKFPAAGLACDAAGILGKYVLSSAAQRAVAQNACLKIKFLADPMIPTSAAANNGRNCIGN